MGALLGAAQLVPSWAHLWRTERASAPWGEIGNWALAPVRLLELVLPGLFMRPQENFSAVFTAFGGTSEVGFPFAASVHVGAAVLLLAALGWRVSRAARALAASALALAWLALGPQLGAQQVLLWLPVVRGFRYPEKYVAALSLVLAVLAALGLDAVRSRAAASDRAARRVLLALVSVAAAAGLFALPPVAGVLAAAGPPEVEELRVRLLLGAAHALPVIAALFAVLKLAASARHRVAGALAVAVVWACSVAAAPYALRPGAPAARVGVPPAPLAPPSDAPIARVVNLGYMPERAPFPGWDANDQEAFDGQAIASPNYNVAQRIDNVDVFTGLVPTRYAKVRDRLPLAWPERARRYSATHAIVPADALPHAGADLVGARFLGVDDRTGARIFALPHRPWASFPPEVITVEEGEAAVLALHAIVAEGTRRKAVVESPVALPASSGRVLRVERARERLVVEAEAGAEATLVVNDAFWPGWRATIDGVEVPILAADVLVRAVRWPPGRHVLEMRYDPPEVRLGIAVSAAAAVALGAYAAGAWLRRRRPKYRMGPSARPAADP
jgi:hypothetical protein